MSMERVENWDAHADKPLAIERRPIRDLAPIKTLTATSFDVGLTRLGCATVTVDVSGFLLSTSEDLRALKERKKISADAPRQARLVWDLLTSHAAVSFAETVNLLEEGESRAKRAKSVAATNYGEYFEIALLNRRSALLHPKGDGGNIPDLVVIESQGGVATSLIRQAYANFHRHLSTYYGTLWRCGLQDAIPLIHKDSGKAKGFLAGCILQSRPDAFVEWMRRECDARDFISWLAVELPGRPVSDADVDRAATKFAGHGDEEGFRTLLRKHMKAYARDRIQRCEGRDPWDAIFETARTKKLEQAGKKAAKKNRTKGGEGGAAPAGEFVASIFEGADARNVAGGSSERADGFLDYVSDADVVLVPDDEGATPGGRALAFGGAKMAIAASKKNKRARDKTDSKLRREYNKVVVLCACETLFEFNPPSDPWYQSSWVPLRSASCATERDKRRDMADAILQGLANLWLCIS